MTPDTTDDTEYTPEITDSEEFDPREYDLLLEWTFDAPREHVWNAWTDPEQVAQWWGPAGFTVPHCELDVRPGGSFHIDMQAPDGTIYPDTGTFHEVVEPERLVVTSRAFEDEDGNAQLEVHQTITFRNHNGRTRLTLEAEVVTATDEMAGPLSGMEEGWSGSFDKLATHLENGDGEGGPQ